MEQEITAILFGAVRYACDDYFMDGIDIDDLDDIVKKIMEVIDKHS